MGVVLIDFEGVKGVALGVRADADSGVPLGRDSTSWGKDVRPGALDFLDRWADEEAAEHAGLVELCGRLDGVASEFGRVDEGLAVS